MSERGQDLIKRAKKAFNLDERVNAQETWALLTEFILPNQNSEWFGNVSKGTRKDRRVFDSTAIQANKELSSAMHSTLTNPAMRWSKLRFREERFNDMDEGSAWLDGCAKVFHNEINDSNFDTKAGQGYQAYTGIGSMIIYQGEDFDFDAWHLAEVSYCENDKGQVDTVYRKFTMTLKQAYDKFGDKLGPDLVAKLESAPLEDYTFYHCIYPRDKKDIKLSDVGLATAKERPFACDYVLEKTGAIVQEDGYYEFPVYIPRWSVLPGEQYGFGPGNIALADVRTLNKIKENHLTALAKAVNPPIVTTERNLISGDFRAGKISYVRDREAFKEMVTGSRFDVSINEIQDLRNSIKSMFYIDKLLLPPRTETGEMTAYEVAQRLEQMQQILGPVLSRLNTEFLQPLVIRSLKILLRQNKLPPLPAKIASELQASGSAVLDFDVTFVNSLARSQQMNELRNIQQWLQESLALAQQGKPEVLDIIDADAIIKYAAKIRNIPENFTLEAKKVQEIRDARSKQQQMAQGLAAGEQGSNIVKNLSDAKGRPAA